MAEGGRGSVQRPSSRIGSLDGLRGLAAVIVVLHHLSLTLVPFSDRFIVPTATHPPTFSAVWWFTSTPVELLIAGPEAVLVFFVLSGLVLTLPSAGGRRTDWFAYYPQRLIRLYLPSAASVLLAAVWLLAVSWSTHPSSSLWVQAARLSPPTPAQVVSGLDLLFGDITINNPLWSLRWEVAFSLLLPVYILLARLVGRWWPLALAACVVLVIAGNLGLLGSLAFLPVFFVGSLIAVRFEDIRSWLDRIGPRRTTAIGMGVLIVSLLLLDLHWTAWGLLGAPLAAQQVLLGVEFLGATGLVLLAAFWTPARVLLSTRLFRWLGRLSFSLYLVHVPVIVALDALFGPHLGLVRIVTSFVAAFVVAVLFSRFVELPAHRLSKRVGRAIRGRDAAARNPAPSRPPDSVSPSGGPVTDPR